MKKSFWLLFVLFLALAIRPVWAVEPMMKLVPSSGTYTKDTSFEVVVAVDSGAVETLAIEVDLKFDPAKVEVVSVEPVTSVLNTLGLISMGASFDNEKQEIKDGYYINSDMHPDEKAPVSGNLLNIKFKPKIVGTINIDFDCTAGSDADSNIFDGTTTADMISCPSNINGVYTITEGGTSVPDPTAVPSNDNPTAIPTQASELPQTGTVETTIGLIIFGIVSVLSSLALKFL